VVKIYSSGDLETWLQSQRENWAHVFAARVALRVLPIWQEARRLGLEKDFPEVILFPLFRATAISWAAARQTRLPLWIAMDTANAATNAARIAATSEASRFAAFAAVSAAQTTTSADTMEPPFVSAARAATYAARSAALCAPADTIWTTVSSDATRVEQGTTASDLLRLPLWPGQQPPEIANLWLEMRRDLLATKQDWDVWIIWYEDRLDGRVRDEERELAYVQIHDALRDEGPAGANAEIKRGIEQHKRKLSEKDTKPSANIRSDIQSPPEAPLPAPSPATQFVVEHGIVDVVPPTAWTGREAQVAAYHARARAIAARLADRLANTDAAPEVAGSVGALLDVLGDDPPLVQPDQVRLASRTIAARARAYGHPSAQWELSVESVSALFELADVLLSLQALARSELEEHERAIQALDLTEASAAQAKEGLDLVADALAVAPEIVSDRTSGAFESCAAASGNAADKKVQVAIERDRVLLTENLLIALAQELAKPEAEQQAKGVPAPVADDLAGDAPPSKRRNSGARWDDLKDRFIERLQAKAPEAFADAALDAITSTIKHSPKSIPALAGLLYSAIVGAPALLAAGGGMTISLAWIGYELWKRNKPPK
jgi:hypothetical protein